MIRTDEQKQLDADNLYVFRQGWATDRMAHLPSELRLRAGCLYKLSGTNGSGKTTLLQLMAGTLGDDQVELLNPGINPVTSQDILYLPHRGGLRRSWTGWQNLDYWCTLMHLKVKDHIQIILEAIDLFHLTDLMTIPVFKLSAGQQQKQALLRMALAQARPLWLLDEVEANLDKHSTYVVHDFVNRHLARDGVVVWATHQELALTADAEISL